jgi:hypothetical protein
VVSRDVVHGEKGKIFVGLKKICLTVAISWECIFFITSYCVIF